MNAAEKAIDILKRTNDGEDLTPEHLWLVEAAVNNSLNPKGLDAFNRLHEQCVEGYVPPWFHGIEHLTRNLEGYILWKGEPVEHYSYTNKDDEKAAAKLLAANCKDLEAKGIEPNFTAVINNWPESKGEPA